VTVIALDHVQLAMPKDEEARAREFYGDLLGMEEVAKPEPLAGRGGVWFERGPVKVHLGVESEFRPALKAHPGIVVDDREALVARLSAAGYEIVTGPEVFGQIQIYTNDPFGNRLELMQG
jgi:catechol 2,3-dioxygenase-like lactoylglutathione lyase family enzyme